METVKIIHDNFAADPRNSDNISTIFSISNSFRDKNFDSTVLKDLSEKQKEKFYSVKSDPVALKDFLLKTNLFVIENLFCYKHGDVALSISNSNPFNCRFDSGQTGFIVIPKSKIREVFSVKNVTKNIIERALQSAKIEVQTFEHYLNGEVYGFQLIKNGEVVDSCYGFYGYDIEENGILGEIPKHLHQKAIEAFHLI